MLETRIFRFIRSALLLTLAFAVNSTFAAEPVRLSYDRLSPTIAFGTRELAWALRGAGFEVSRILDASVSSEPQRVKTITFDVADGDGEVPRGFAQRCDGTHLHATGANAREVMYAALDLAEAVRLGRDIFTAGERRHEPYIEHRGIKFNIPLDARTPSYDDSGDAAQRNIEEMWNMKFWTLFLDQMARDHYNMLSLWNPHPFPSMINSPDFPDVALDDVCTTTLVPNGRENEWGEPQLVSENVVNNLRTIKKITIAQKIEFWREVMSHATKRGIDIYFITWNICPNSVAQPVPAYHRTYANSVPDEQPGKYGVTHDVHNPATIRYLRDAVKTFILTYPDLKGIGATAGEHFPDGDDFDREEWMWETYGRGVLDAKQEQPGREVDFIHRVWNTDLQKIMARWSEYPDTFDLGFKYAKARLYSSPDMPFANELIEAMKPHGLKAWWNLRNDDIFVHRWGDPDYVRAFLQNFDLEATAGYHMGSDGYVWGREFVSKYPKKPRELEITKHWYAFMLWGRLGYDPTLDRDFFVARLAEHFPRVDAAPLHDTWQTASKIIPLVNRFYWRDWDHMWSVENSQSHVEGFHGVLEFCDNTPMEGSGIVGIRDHVRAALAANTTHAGTTPLEVANELDALADAAITGADALPDSRSSRDLRDTLDDIRGMSWLGRYYADKIRAALALVMFQETGDATHHGEAVTHIQNAYEDCTRYVDLSQARYHPQMLARTGRFDWAVMLNNARKDVAIVRAAKPSRPHSGP